MPFAATRPALLDDDTRISLRPEPGPNTWRGVLAALDLGSNSFRLELAQLQRGEYKRIDSLKATVRLGAGLDADQRLTPAAVARGLACLQRFRERLDGIPPQQVRAVATQTLREAVNRNEFLAAAQATLGHPIEVISGREEARLIYLGVHRLQPADHRRLVIDIGGRSTEIILGEGPNALVAESFQIGSVSLSSRHFADGRFTAEAFRAAQITAGAELEDAFTTFRGSGFIEALGSSGTAGAVSEVLAASGRTDGTITLDGLQWCIRACLDAGHADALDLPGLKPERRAVVGGGVALLYTLLTQFGIDAIRPTRGALRQGVIFDLRERLAAARASHPHDRRDDGALELQRRFGADPAQAERVRVQAQRLYDRLGAGDASLADSDSRRELGWAAQLHEVGMMVSHHNHHRHSAYLVGMADLDGFSQSQQEHLAALVLGQRGGLRKLDGVLDLGAITPTGVPTASARRPWTSAAQLLCLRLAVLLCHPRSDDAARGCDLTLRQPPGPEIRDRRSGVSRPGEPARVLVQLGAQWAEHHPRTRHLLEAELGVWKKQPLLRVELIER